MSVMPIQTRIPKANLNLSLRTKKLMQSKLNVMRVAEIHK